MSYFFYLVPPNFRNENWVGSHPPELFNDSDVDLVGPGLTLYLNRHGVYYLSLSIFYFCGGPKFGTAGARIGNYFGVVGGDWFLGEQL